VSSTTRRYCHRCSDCTFN